MNMDRVKIADILLVEDNPGDVRLATEAMKESQIHHRLWTTEDGEKALHFLRHQAEYAEAPRPDLILLDLNLPKKNGYQVLDEIKTDSDLALIPVIVFSTSTAADDIQRAYQLHANCYVSKPIDFDRFLTVVKGIQSYWFSIAQLPRDRSHE